MHNNYKTNIPEIDDKISSLVNNHFASGNSDILRQMFTAVAKAGLESSDTGEMKLLNRNIKELRYAFRVFSEYRDVRKVAIFGSSRTRKNQTEYHMAEEFARKIAQKGFMVMTGAGDGIMEAGNKGAGKDNSFGVNILLPIGQKPNQFISNDRLINFKYFFTRKLVFLKESDATVLFPGGFGTLDEGVEVLTLVQTGKSKPRPIIFLEPEGSSFWKEWNNFIHNKLLKNNYISEEDLSLFQVLSNIDQAIDEIENFYSVYHSIRFVKNKTVLRLKKSIPNETLQKINELFKDILTDGVIAAGPPLKDEVKNNEYMELPRLIMLFNRKSFGRLMELIRFLSKNVD
tara:strand:+ start:5749 stop:6780 length:1032 start_codon:yes stop_codon:yes gene_type:complete